MRCEPPVRHFRYGRRHGPPPVIMRMGCAFAFLIVCAAVGGSVLVAFFSREVAIAAMAGAFVLFIVFATTIRGAARVFREQQHLRRQLMADVAHELRTPLAILQGRIEGLIDGVYPRDDEHLGELLTETQHLSRLVEDVRTLANAEAGALDLRKEKVDLGELIRDAAAAMPPAVAVDVPEDLPPVEADPVRIREVLLNLLTNAMEHAPEGSVSVAATARARDVVIVVRDNGPGIPPDELARVFDRFHKGRHSRGTGLGLSIARKLVVAHGGDIRVESSEGIGTTVIVKIPR